MHKRKLLPAALKRCIVYQNKEKHEPYSQDSAKKALRSQHSSLSQYDPKLLAILISYLPNFNVDHENGMAGTTGSWNNTITFIDKQKGNNVF